MKYSQVALAILMLMGASSAAYAQKTPLPTTDDQFSPIEQSVPSFSYNDPYSRQFSTDLPQASIIIDDSTNRIYIATNRGTFDAPLESAATAYAQQYANGSPTAAQDSLNEVRTNLRDTTFLAEWVHDLNGNGIPDEVANNSQAKCFSAFACDSFQDDWGWNTVFDFGKPPTPPPPPIQDPTRIQRLLQCKQEATDVRDDLVNATVLMGVACAFVPAQPGSAIPACLAGGWYVGRMTQRMTRKVQECRRI